ncbi:MULTISPECIES: DeoR/GlpR family DNA-binding transcription regulator [Erwiniaceae]|uniref:DeoR/GlpR family DNA-binding transcription regulator n=1 Tax=Erwiniaceae TaxID=1903409 RepID=UPI00190AEA73|nr:MULTISPECIES: DeoR/GlpR family DNA-binding transcription regulator [Erwiniaceae]MBK0093428.1 DeoR/GlpR transcriptional regulator [Erwinia sp. S59]MBK0123694.1 DeoR/GlpR transcriptional regulator [Pantoea sp. S61]
MNTAERRQQTIIELLGKQSFVDLHFLTEELHVSVATVRRDLDELEHAGKIRRTHGGAVAVNQVAQDVSFKTRAVSYLPQKRAIAKQAIARIATGDAVLLDAGTTTLEIAKLLAGRSDLTVISHGADVINELTQTLGRSFYSVGGEYSEPDRSFRGPLAEMMIRQFNVDKLFLNASSFDFERGMIFNSDPTNASIQRTMIEVATYVIVVADHSKFMKSNLSTSVRIDDVDIILTDSGAKEIIKNIPDKYKRKFVFSD